MALKLKRQKLELQHTGDVVKVLETAQTWMINNIHTNGREIVKPIQGVIDKINKEYNNVP